MLTCPRCGASVREGKAFCYNCGAQMGAVVKEAEEPPPEFRETLAAPPQPQRRTTPAPTATPTEPRTASPISGAPHVAPTLTPLREDRARGFFSRGTWLFVAILLLLVILAFIAGALSSD